MNTAKKLFDNLHLELYPRYLQHCSGVAFTLMQSLREAGKSPSILQVSPQTTSELLIPRPYGDNLRWYMHIICASDGIIYDPIFVSPTPALTYYKAAFDQVVLIADISDRFD